LDERTKPESKLADTTQNNVHNNLLIVAYFAGGFEELGVHNRLKQVKRLTRINSQGAIESDRASEVAADNHYRLKNGRMLPLFFGNAFASIYVLLAVSRRERTKPLLAAPLLLWARSRCRILNVYLEGSQQRCQVNHVVRGRPQCVSKICCHRGYFHADPVPPQFDGEICKIGISGHHDNEIWPHLDATLDCTDRHHHVNDCLA